MSGYAFTFGFFVTSDKGRRFGPPRLERLSDELMHAMLERETDLAFDSSVGAALMAGEVDVDLVVAEESVGPQRRSLEIS